MSKSAVIIRIQPKLSGRDAGGSSGTCRWLPARLNQQGLGIYLITRPVMYALLNQAFLALNHTVCVLNHTFFALYNQKNDMYVTKDGSKCYITAIHNRNKCYVTEIRYINQYLL